LPQLKIAIVQVLLRNDPLSLVEKLAISIGQSLRVFKLGLGQSRVPKQRRVWKKPKIPSVGLGSLLSRCTQLGNSACTGFFTPKQLCSAIARICRVVRLASSNVNNYQFAPHRHGGFLKIESTADDAIFSFLK
jgi:hypothetical protein